VGSPSVLTDGEENPPPVFVLNLSRFDVMAAMTLSPRRLSASEIKERLSRVDVLMEQLHAEQRSALDRAGAALRDDTHPHTQNQAIPSGGDGEASWLMGLSSLGQIVAQALAKRP
jgi:hypothetical protein